MDPVGQIRQDFGVSGVDPVAQIEQFARQSGFPLLGGVLFGYRVLHGPLPLSETARLRMSATSLKGWKSSAIPFSSRSLSRSVFCISARARRFAKISSMIFWSGCRRWLFMAWISIHSTPSMAISTGNHSCVPTKTSIRWGLFKFAVQLIHFVMIEIVGARRTENRKADGVMKFVGKTGARGKNACNRVGTEAEQHGCARPAGHAGRIGSVKIQRETRIHIAHHCCSGIQNVIPRTVSRVIRSSQDVAVLLGSRLIAFDKRSSASARIKSENDRPPTCRCEIGGDVQGIVLRRVLPALNIVVDLSRNKVFCHSRSRREPQENQSQAAHFHACH